MLAAATGLIQEGAISSGVRASIGVVVGFGVVALLHRFLSHHAELHVARLRGADALKATMTLGAMLALSVAEGVGVGVANAGRASLGIVVTLAIALENVPQGFAISLVLVPRGTRTTAAGLWSIFSSLPQPLIAVPAFLFVHAFAHVLPAGLGFAGGALVWVALFELGPDALTEAPRRTVAAWSALSFAPMVTLELTLLHVT